MPHHVYKGAWTEKQCQSFMSTKKEFQSFMRKLESTWNKQQKAKKMERKFVGKVVSDGPVTMREAREAGLIKGEPKEATQEEHAEAIKAMEDNEKAVKKAREDEKDSNR